MCKNDFIQIITTEANDSMMMTALADAPTRAEGEPNLDKMAEIVHHLFKFKHFYDRWISAQIRG